LNKVVNFVILFFVCILVILAITTLYTYPVTYDVEYTSKLIDVDYDSTWLKTHTYCYFENDRVEKDLDFEGEVVIGGTYQVRIYHTPFTERRAVLISEETN
jgi:hypothetical protein